MDLFTSQPATSASDPAFGISLPPRRFRSACDRCHSQKLRCTRHTGQSTCERCLKLKTICHFGLRAARTSLRPRAQATGRVATPNLHSDPLIVNANISDWFMPSSMEAVTGEEPASMQPELQYSIHQSDNSSMQDMYGHDTDFRRDNLYSLDDYLPIHEGATSYTDPGFSLPDISSSSTIIRHHDTNKLLGASSVSTVEELASLNVALYGCAAKLPSRARAEVNTVPDSVYSTQRESLFAIDEVFRFTTEFTDVLKYLSCVDAKYPGNTAASPTRVYSQQLLTTGQPDITTGTERLPLKPLSQVDEATMHMVMSCHCLLTEIYVSIFQMMQACIEHSLVPRTSDGWAIVLPQLQVGCSVVSPPRQVDSNNRLSSAANTLLYKLTITILSSQLWDQLAGVVKAGISRSPESTSSSPLVDMMWNAVMEKTDYVSQKIDAIKRLLQQRSSV